MILDSGLLFLGHSVYRIANNTKLNFEYYIDLLCVQ